VRFHEIEDDENDVSRAIAYLCSVGDVGVTWWAMGHAIEFGFQGHGRFHTGVNEKVSFIQFLVAEYPQHQELVNAPTFLGPKKKRRAMPDNLNPPRVSRGSRFRQRTGKALEDEQFFLVYQPEIDLHSNAFVGVEATYSWRHPRRGVLSPTHSYPSSNPVD